MGRDTLLLLLKPDEAAVALGCSRAKVYGLIAAGKLPSVKLGSSVRIPVDALQDWIRKELATSQSVGSAA